jgi:hypothetical protein
VQRSWRRRRSRIRALTSWKNGSSDSGSTSGSDSCDSSGSTIGSGPGGPAAPRGGPAAPRGGPAAPRGGPEALEGQRHAAPMHGASCVLEQKELRQFCGNYPWLSALLSLRSELVPAFPPWPWTGSRCAIKAGSAFPSLKLTALMGKARPTPYGATLPAHVVAKNRESLSPAQIRKYDLCLFVSVNY